MTVLVLLAIAGLCVGAGVGAAKNRAPTAVVAAFYALAAVGLVVAGFALVSG